VRPLSLFFSSILVHVPSSLAAAVGFKDAIRSLYPLYHRLDQGEISKVTFSQLQDALPSHFTIPWTHIAERLLSGTNSKLDGLSKSEKAQVLFMSIYSFVFPSFCTFSTLVLLLTPSSSTASVPLALSNTLMLDAELSGTSRSERIRKSSS
jgi:hypothetical protein